MGKSAIYENQSYFNGLLGLPVSCCDDRRNIPFDAYAITAFYRDTQLCPADSNGDIYSMVSPLVYGEMGKGQLMVLKL